MPGTIVAIAIAAQRMQPMREIDRVDVSMDNGLQGDVRGGVPNRQVTILFEDDWHAACEEVAVDLPWLTRRANFLVKGIENPRQLGVHLKIGDVELEVMEETEPCALMEKAQSGLRKALASGWRGGLSCRVTQRGTVAIGQTVEIAVD